MREIKFRVWDKETKHIHIFGDDIHDAITSEGKTNKIYYYNLQNGCDSLDEDSDYVLMQYTGLKDKNGQEIYEGDIVKRSLRDKDERIYFEDFYVIIFDKAAFQYKGIKEYYISETGRKWKQEEKEGYRQDLGSNFGVNIKDIEVIGNIYNNPELLEK